ncbi:MAG: hypothetical protein AAGA87_06965 [Pseudomonadota bacterium]
MAHSILEYGDRHITMRDMELTAALEALHAAHVGDPAPELAFLPAFMSSGMLHITGGIDPEFGTHLSSPEAQAAFLDLIDRTQATAAAGDPVVGHLAKLRGLISGDTAA